MRKQDEWTPTQHDPLCRACSEPKHTHLNGTGPTTTPKVDCPGFQWPDAATLAALPDPVPADDAK